jgi:hypothetical protein
MKYQVFGDYGYTSECLLWEGDSEGEAVRWADGYTRHGDLGGYGLIEVARFADDGEFVCIKAYYN